MSAAALPRTSFDVERVRRDFPILAQSVNGKPLVYTDNVASSQRPKSVSGKPLGYLDNAASSQRPQSVIDAI